MNRRHLLEGFPASLFISAASGSLAGLDVESHQQRRHSDDFPNIQLITHEGRKVRFRDDLIRDRNVMINFMYAACGDICPGMTANLVKVQRLLGQRMGRDFSMYSITLEPEHDTAQLLKGYRELFHVQPGWWFLSGLRSDIKYLRRQLGMYNPDPVIDADLSQHTGMVIIGNDSRDRWMSCPALGKPEYVARSINSMMGWAVKPLSHNG